MKSTEKTPNIILITTDQQRYDAMGLNNPSTDLCTPVCDQLAASGMNFTRAFTTCPVCIPARRSLLTGLHPESHGLRHYQDGLEWDPPFTLPGLLSRAGWQTELIGKLHLHPQRKRYGYDHMVRTESPNDRWDTPLQPENDWVDFLKEKGYPHPNDIGINGNGRIARPWDKDENLHHTSWLADKAVDFIVKYRDPSCPFFLHLSFWAPHPPLIPPQAYWDRYYRHHGHRPSISDWTPKFKEIPRGIPDDRARGPFSEEDMHAAAAGYFGLINHIDDRIRYVLTRMFEYGSPRANEPTVIIFTTDHGELLGDHHLWRKSLPYEGAAHIPFFISWRNMNLKGGSCDRPVCLEDVAATVLDLCGQPVPEALKGNFDSRSLAPLLRGQTIPVRNELLGVFDGGGGGYFLISGKWKYIWFFKTDEEQLFDIDSDPCELHDLSGDPSLLAPMREIMALCQKKCNNGRPYDISKLKPCSNRPPKALWN